MTYEHRTVMCREAVAALAPRSGGIYADATLGGAGHAEAILEASAPEGRLIGVDRDPRAVAAAAQRLARFGQRATLVHAAFAELGEVLHAQGVARVQGVIADLGVSSPQLDDADRGFSFREEGPLDMRMDTTRGETVIELIARLSESDLADLIYGLGEERKSRRIARAIKLALGEDRLQTTADLRRAVLRGTGPERRGRDPSTRTFQALRIAVNGELDQLDALLLALPSLLEDEGVGVLISFHSLEDRRVKVRFRECPELAPLTKKPLVPGDEELAENPRARSAKLRAARRIAREHTS